MTALRWIDGLFAIKPEEIIAILPRLLTHLLPALASDVVQVRQAAERVNNAILRFVDAPLIKRQKLIESLF